MEKKFYLPDFDYEVVIGKYAQQADGAVWIQQKGTVVLSTVVCAPSKEFPGFLPLTVDYRRILLQQEKFLVVIIKEKVNLVIRKSLSAVLSIEHSDHSFRRISSISYRFYRLSIL